MAAEDLAEAFQPAAVEGELYASWEQQGHFSSKPEAGRESFSIVLPPPNVTGSLHLGHAFQHTLMDALCRYHRMRGRNVLWQPGVDHAGIATQLVVTREIERSGRDPAELDREQLLDEIWAWKARSGTTITTQMRRLGASCDWQRERFTMDEGLSKTVSEVFVRMHEQGLIYRGKRMVNWDPVLLTAVSDLEVVTTEEDAVMYHVRYPFVDAPDDGMVIATTRPETILADGVVAVAPGDPKHKANLGRWVRVPGTERTIEVIEDEHVDPDFGSGCVKITPAHDFNDFEVMLRHPDKNIPVIVLMTPTAHMSDAAPERYRGLDRFAARKMIVEDLREEKLLLREEAHSYQLPRGDRSGAVVEPMLTDQWFVKAKPLAEQALQTATSGRMRFVPENWRGVYNSWLENIHDWCISRQLVWGHRIPAWHDEQGNIFVAETEEQARAKCGDDRALRQDPDVLDTWFSSALWPFSTLGWPNESDEHFKHYFPTSVLVTGFDIIFFWVARMVMMSERFTGREPFAEVYITGLVRDARGNKMSKSKGNIIDPLDMVDGIALEDLVAKRTDGLMIGDNAKAIEAQTRRDYPDGIPAYGADAIRLTFAALASYGRDIKFDLGRVGGWRHFCNKLWNATRYVLAVTEDWDGSLGERDFVDRWMVSKLQQTEKAVEQHFAVYRFDLIAEDLHHLLWDDFCDWYIEMSKVRIGAGGPGKTATQAVLVQTLAAILRLAHPLAPFVTERLFGYIGARAGFDQDSIMQTPYPVCDEAKIDESAVQQAEQLRSLVRCSRSLRSNLGIDPGVRLTGALAGPEPVEQFVPYLERLARLEKVSTPDDIKPGEHPILPVGSMLMRLDVPGVAWQDQLRGQAAKLQSSHDAGSKRLANSQFAAKAPAHVVDALREQLADTQNQLDELEKIISSAKA